MANENRRVDFSFGWLALKILGKSLYSNAWSAISELVANSFDADAKDVYIYIDISKKNDAIIEILDNGIGMDNSGIRTYAKVGYNRRIELTKPTDDDYLTMGRKGIGKLAALYLSENYYLITKTDSQETKWRMIYKENPDDTEEKPFIYETTENINLRCWKEWDAFSKGTLLRLNSVNLSGLGESAYDSLEKKLSNSFALDSLGNRKIHLCITNSRSEKVTFHLVQKEIAFKNMAFIDYYSNKESSIIKKIAGNTQGRIIKFPLKRLNRDQYYSHIIETEKFDSIESIESSGKIKCVSVKGEEIEKNYELTGWIGIHSTIDLTQARQNDSLFSRNRYYNPIQLRLYVRNKLAIENFLNVLNNTQAFVNYIEGEIHFNVLDEDDLPDIATSNRQGLDEHDSRVRLLVTIVNKIVTNLITKRADLAEKIRKEEERLKDRQDDNAKKQFAQEVEKEVGEFPNLNESEKASLTSTITNKIKGDVAPKNDYIVFLSHARDDKLITDFFYEVLIARGAKPEEFFYSSRRDTVAQYDNLDSLAIQIKKNIVKDSALLFFLTSNAYKSNEICMFEGGAGWATRSIGEYIVITLTYKEIPSFITNGKLEFCLERDKTIIFDQNTYLFIVKVLNRMISHINAGRRINSDIEIPLYDVPSIPNALQMSQEGKTLYNYMDDNIKKYWDFYIDQKQTEYMNTRYKKK